MCVAAVFLLKNWTFGNGHYFLGGIHHIASNLVAAHFVLGLFILCVTAVAVINLFFYKSSFRLCPFWIIKAHFVFAHFELYCSIQFRLDNDLGGHSGWIMIWVGTILCSFITNSFLKLRFKNSVNYFRWPSRGPFRDLIGKLV